MAGNFCPTGRAGCWNAGNLEGPFWKGWRRCGCERAPGGIHSPPQPGSGSESSPPGCLGGDMNLTRQRDQFRMGLRSGGVVSVSGSPVGPAGRRGLNSCGAPVRTRRPQSTEEASPHQTHFNGNFFLCTFPIIVPLLPSRAPGPK